MSVLHRHVILKVAVALLASTTAVVVAGDLARLHGAAARSGRSVRVGIITHDVPIGRVVSSGDVATRNVPVDAAPSDALASGRVIGRVAAVTLLRGTIVTDRHLTDRAHALRAGERLVAVPVLATPPMTSGDRVDVYGAGADGELEAVPGARRVARDARVRSIRHTGRETTVVLVVRAAEVPGVMTAAGSGSGQLAVANPDGG